jgi:cobalt-zinc-cadmium resistance protein CzcA
MIDRVIAFAVEQRVLVALLMVALTGWGVYSVQQVPIDAFPDVTNNQVQIMTKVPGMSPVEVEKLVTYPVEVAMTSLPDVVENRSISQFGLSVVTIVFEDEVDIYFARQLVFERLSEVRENLPAGAEPNLGPLSTGLSEIYQYTLRDVSGDGESYSNMDLRELQDWILVPELRTVPGVIEVNSLGGYVKQYQVLIDPNALINYHVSLDEVYRTLEESNQNVGGQYIERGDEQFLVRGLGLLGTEADVVEDLEQSVITSRDGTPVLIRDVASVERQPAVRFGGATMNGVGETVAGVVLMLKGSNADQVVEGVEQKLETVKAALPEGVELDVYYDRTELTEAAIGTVTTSLMIGALLVIVVLIAFLGDWRSAFIVSLVLPMTALITFILMDEFTISANLMSLGGLAIGLGMFVDGAIVMVENVYRLKDEHPDLPIGTVVLQAGQEVGRPIAFAVGVVIAVFLPLFTLQELEGRMFRPLAFTISFALLAALFLAVTMAPAFSAFLLKGKGAGSDASGGGTGESNGSASTVKEDDDEPNMLMRWTRSVYAPVLDAALRQRRRAMGVAGAVLVGGLAIFPFLGTEFVPRLEEGSLAVQVFRQPSVSLDASLRITGDVERALMSFPEITNVVSKTGRPEVATDPMGPEISDVMVTLADRETWRFESKEALVGALRERLETIPGISLSFSQPIALRVDELISGVKSEVAAKIYGPDMDVLTRLGAEVAATLRSVDGAADVKAEQTTGLGYLQVKIKRDAAARFGLTIGTIQQTIQTAVGGSEATEVLEGERRFAVVARYQKDDRDTPQAIRDIRLETPAGEVVRLGDVADVGIEQGPAQVSREQSKRRLTVESNVTGRDIGSFVSDAQSAIARSVDLPTGYYIDWGGQFENQKRAQRRLMVIVPITVAIIFVLLFMTFRSIRQAALVLLNIPVSLIGGIVILWLTGLYMSVPATVGFIALLGIAVQNGIVMISFINDRTASSPSLREAVYEGAMLRLRPILMTGATTLLGLLPLLFATGLGAGVQRPLAAVVVGGLFTTVASTLLLLPVLYLVLEPAPKRPVGHKVMSVDSA